MEEMRVTFQTTHQKLKQVLEKKRAQKRAQAIMDIFNMIEPSTKQKKVFTWWRDKAQ